jgi:cyanate lyase
MKQEIPFNPSEIITLLEITRFALADADTYEQVAEDLDLSDDYLFELRGKLQKFLDNPASI